MFRRTNFHITDYVNVLDTVSSPNPLEHFYYSFFASNSRPCERAGNYFTNAFSNMGLAHIKCLSISD